MENIIIWILFGVGGLAILGFVAYQIFKIVKMTPEAKKERIITYLQGLVVLTEAKIGEGHGEEKLAEVEAYFNEYAPWLIKLLFKITGQDSLQELIEIALKGVKKSFEK